MASFLFLAQDLYVPPATENAIDIRNLFNITMAIALVVFVLVEGLLIYMILRFRKNTRVPKDETHRGHTTAEVVWTVIPAALLLFLGFLSAGTLVQIDEVPEDTDFTVWVQASQFSWRYIYPDEQGTEYNGGSLADWCRGPTAARCDFTTLRLQEGSRVHVKIIATDVIHAFAIPEFGVKRDAVPGKVHEAWFETPRVAEGADTQEYFVQCMEFCGAGHHLMGPSKEAVDNGQAPRLVVFREGSQALPWGRETAVPPPTGETTPP